MAGWKVHFEGVERQQEIRHGTRIEDVRSLPQKLSDLADSPAGTFKLFGAMAGASLLFWAPERTARAEGEKPAPAGRQSARPVPL